jgi:hypothetical protein
MASSLFQVLPYISHYQIKALFLIHKAFYCLTICSSLIIHKIYRRSTILLIVQLFVS